MRFRFLWLLIFICSLISCQKQDGRETVDLIHVVREGATIPAYIYGNTESQTFVIILHGGPGGNGLEYKFGTYSERLEEEYAVVYTDQRGQGMSQSTASSPAATVELMTKDVYALALTLREKYGDDISLFLLGHSWGGLLGTSVMVSSEYASTFDGWIEVDGAHDFGLTYVEGHKLIDSVCVSMVNQDINVDVYLSFLDRLNETQRNEVTLDNFSVINGLAFEVESQLQIDGLITASDPETAIDALKYQFFVNNYLTSQVSGSYTNANLFANDLFSVSFTDQLKNITTPTLLLWGAMDMVVAPEVGRSAFRELAIEEKELVIFGNSGHSPMDSEAEQFVDSVIEFIETYK